jgi:hypothetical protein
MVSSLQGVLSPHVIVTRNCQIGTAEIHLLLIRVATFQELPSAQLHKT